MHPGPLVQATFHESGETATVQVANDYFQYRLSDTAKKILLGHATYFWTAKEQEQFFTPIEETK